MNKHERHERVASLIVLCLCLIISVIGSCCFGVASTGNTGAAGAVLLGLACICAVIAFSCIFLIICWVVLFVDTHRDKGADCES